MTVFHRRSDHALGGGVGNTVQAIAISGNDVYVGGQLGSAGGAPVSGVARWDGSQWSALGDGISGSTGYYEVHALAIAGDDLYVGGIFDRAGGAPANSIARWNTSSHTWSALGSGIVRSAQAGTVNALAYSAGSLYAGGTFDHAGGGTARNVAVWDGNAWLPLGAGIVGEVDALANWNGALYAGGRLQSSNAVPLHNLARWTGSAWVDVGGGTLGDVTALTGTLAGLFVGGGFDTAGGNAHAPRRDRSVHSAPRRHARRPAPRWWPAPVPPGHRRDRSPAPGRTRRREPLPTRCAQCS